METMTSSSAPQHQPSGRRGGPGRTPAGRGSAVRQSVDLEHAGTPVRLVRSSRRTRTVSATWREGRLQVSVPMGLGDRAELDWVQRMVERAGTRYPHGTASDTDLLERARRLARTYLEGAVEPTAVVWSPRQQRRWGSCTTQTGRIRVSSELAQMPDWVLDGVLVHELAHLKHPDHSPRFHALAERYPRQREAMAFLAGVSHATGRGLGGIDDGADESEDQGGD